MDRVRFEIETVQEEPFAGEQDVVVYVNGERLDELVEGGFRGLSPAVALPPSRQYLGEPYDEEHAEHPQRPSHPADGDGVVVLRCGCGYVGCSSIQAHVVVEEERVLWRDFRGQRRRETARLGEFVFDREQYESALGNAVRQSRSS